MDTSEKSSTLDNRGGPIWGSRAMSVLSDPAATVMIFPLTDDLVQRQGEQGL
jgi:hypothetical protein